MEVQAPEDMACSVSPTLPVGTCSAGACEIRNAPSANWRWRPGRHHWKLAGLAPGQGLLLAESSSPDDPDFEGPYSVCRLTRFDPSQPDHESVLHEGEGPCSPWVLHRRHAVGTRWSPEAGRQVWTLLSLDGSTPARDFDLTSLLNARLAAEGVTASTEKPLWVQGAPGQLLLVWPLQGGKVWIASLTLPGLEFAWTRQVAGTLEGSPIADELGRLYFSVDPAGVVSLSPEGVVRWTLNGAGQPVAVFRDTLFLDDGTVRSTADGGVRYSWPAAQASVFLSESHAAVIAPCGTNACTRVTLLRRGSGEVLADVPVPDASPEYRGTETSALLTANGAVLVLQRVQYPDLMYSPFYPFQGVRRFLVREGQPLQSLGELLVPTGEHVELNLLSDGQWVAVERDSFHNDADPGADLIGVSTPGLRAPEHGWLTPRGNSAGGSAPE
ncbi:hypothetical protein F0U61_44540 [Archangium violaceum]|uniref:hypothetical protein n=1 Tax=Archangium violaceum TaxID=83451 RepID=UPI002B2A8921|nr:hypothetical protein F0U61_44540 [Archangium violaceum]